MAAAASLDMALDDIIESTAASGGGGGGGRRGTGRGRGVGRGGARRGTARGGARRGGGMSRGGSRPKPYSRRPKRDGTEEISVLGERVIKVAATSTPKTVAGSISHISRSGDAPSILCCGPEAINQAIKAVAISRTYLEEDGIDFRAVVDFVSRDSAEATVTLTKTPLREHKEIEMEELTVKRDSDPYKVAGAAANRIRENKRVCINALGPDAVFRAVESSAVTRRYLVDDGLDVQFVPQFYHVETSSGVRSALRFTLFAAQV